jgi:hypothetical protein
VRDEETDSTSPVLRVCVVHSMLKCETLHVSFRTAAAQGVGTGSSTDGCVLRCAVQCYTICLNIH